MTKTKLTPFQTLFTEAYCGQAQHNASEAYRLAGGKSHRAAQKGYEIMRNEKVALAIQEKLDKKASKFHVKEDEILGGLYKEATREDEGSSQQGRIQAWVHLGKHLGMFREKDKVGPQKTVFNIVNYNTDNKKIKEIKKQTELAIIEGEINDED